MTDEIKVTITDSDALNVVVESDVSITIQDTEVTEQNNVADETPLEITVEVDPVINIAEGSQIKDTHISEKFTGLTGVNQELELGNTFRSGSCRVFLNGVLMEKDVDYTESIGRDSIVILITLATSDKIEVDYVIE